LKKTRNKFEESIRKQLRKAKIKFTYESERIPYILCRHYIPDFILITPNGKIYIECKGYLRPEDKSKMSAIKRLNPKLDIRLLFYENRPKQIKWAERVGFRYAIGTIPIEWLEGM
jgi:predicted nuclease of restriction endonuclease-like RecB superfamily